MVSRKFLLKIAKWSVVTICAVYLYQHYDQFDWHHLEESLEHLNNWTIILGLFILLFLTLINWYFDTLLWWKVAGKFKKMSFPEALTFNLMAHTAGIITPNNLGEYGIRALQFEEVGDKKKSVFLTFSYRMSKWIVKIAFAGFALISLIITDPFITLTLYALLLSALALGYVKASYLLKLLHDSRMNKYFFTEEELKASWDFNQLKMSRTILPATFKFLAYTLQLVLILELINPYSFTETFGWSILLYSGASIIPTLGLFDAAIKISLGAELFPSQHYDASLIALALSLIWMLNMAIPAVVGSVFMLGHTSKSTTKPS